MEAPEEVMVGSKEHTHILKGKRTKRQRPQSPIPYAITTNSSSGDGGGGGGGGFDSTNNNGDNNNQNITTMLMLSPTNSNEYNNNQDRTEEEEDMANCLILLAQGQSRESLPKESDDDAGNYKFNSRRFMETANPTGTGKAGYYVYECKTCNRTFPSFQALGGHRASHKKPKAMAPAPAAAEEKRNFTLSSDEEEGHFKNISSLSLQLSNKGLYNNTNNNISNTKSKVHECSVCGAEFTSGQALGGHMRRHRGPTGTNTTLSLTPMAMESEEPIKKPRNVLSLDLDLNLPAPEDDHRESKFSFASTQQEKQQQQQQQKSPLVFSAPTLVDCHY